MKLFILVIILFILLIKGEHKNKYKIQFQNKYEYIENNQFKFGIDFNHNINQPRFVWYIQPENPIICKNRNYKNVDYSNIKIEDYSGFYSKYSIEKCHLVPAADFSCAAHINIMSNIIPQYKKFNRGIWKKSVDYIRHNYIGKLIIKSCSNDQGYYMTTLTNKTLFVPEECYFVVFDNFNINEYEITGNIKYYGKLESKPIINCINFENCLYKELPDYIIENNNNIENLCLFVFIFIIVCLIAIYNKINK